MKALLSAFILAGVVTVANGAPIAPYVNAGNPKSLEESVQGVSVNDPAVVNILKNSQAHRLPTREGMITNPQGERKNYTEESSISWYSIGDYLYSWGFGEIPAHMIYDGNTVYMANPVTQIAFEGYEGDLYMQGIVDGDEMTFELPQLYYQNEVGGEVVNYYVDLLYPIELPSGPWFVPEQGVSSTTLTFTFEDGQWVMEGGTEGDFIIGVTCDKLKLQDYEGYGWTGFGDSGCVYTPFDYTVTTPPETATIENWKLILNGVGRDNRVAFDGNEVYVENFAYPNVVGTWVKGTIQGDMVVFDSDQYLGKYELGNAYIFFMVGKTVPVYYPEWDFWGTGTEFQESYSMNYDSEKKTMSSTTMDEEGLFILINNGNKKSQWYGMFENFEILYQPENISLVPMNPTFQSAMPFNDMYGYGNVSFLIPALNKDGYVLNPENLYFNLYLDGELFEFTPEEYPILTEDMINVPWELTDYSMVYGTGATHTIKLYVEGISSYGLQSLYIDGDEIYKSDLVSNVETGVNNIFDKDIKSIVYYDLTGNKVSEPVKGNVYIMSVTYDNGERKVKKFIR